MHADNVSGDLVTIRNFLKRFAGQDGVFNPICQQRGAHEVGPKRCQFKGVQHGAFRGKHLNDTIPAIDWDSDREFAALYIL